MSRNLRLGIFLACTLAVLALGIFIIGSKKYLFTSTYSLVTTFPNVVGLSVGADILVGGVHSGTVRAIELPSEPGKPITVRLEMDSNTHKIVKKDSVATIQTEGLLGNQYIAVSFGAPGQPDVKSGDTIGSIAPVEMSALVNKASAILDSSQTAINNVTAITANLKDVSGKINDGKGTAGALVNDRTLYNNLADTSAEAKKTVASAQTGIASFSDNMEALKHNFLLRGYFKSRGYEDSSDLEKDAVESLPQAAPVKDFTIQAKQLFDKQNSAKLKNGKALKEAGEALGSGDFGLAVVQSANGSTGDSESSLTVSQARAMVVRDYLVGHFGFDDSKLKTAALGKQTDLKSDSDWGVIHILIYPTGTPIPAPAPDAKAPAGKPAADSNK